MYGMSSKGMCQPAFDANAFGAKPSDLDCGKRHAHLNARVNSTLCGRFAIATEGPLSEHSSGHRASYYLA